MVTGGREPNEAAAARRAARRPPARGSGRPEPSRLARPEEYQLDLVDPIGPSSLPDMLELVFRPDRDAPEPVYRQLADYLRGLIETRRLLPGQKLPASRELAGALGVSRNTVGGAYQALADAQLVTAHVGQGTFVAPAAAAAAARRYARAAVPAPAPGAPREFVWDSLFAARARHFRLPRPGPRGPRRFDLRAGGTDLSALPGRELRAAFARALAQGVPAHGNEIDPFGFPPLREAIARSLVARGIACAAEDVLVTSGAQQGLDLVARLLLDPGDAAVVEQPGYFGAALAFRAAEARLVGVEVDEHGLRTDDLARVLRSRRPKLVYTTPAVQCPTGVALAPERRQALLALAEETQTPVVDDDYDGELRLDGPASPALKTLDRAGQVIYLGTFSKAVFPGLRLGYVVAARALLERLAAAKLTADFATALVPQMALADWLASGGLARHVRGVRRRYAERMDALLAALGRALPAGSAFARPAGGNALWLCLPPELDPARLHSGLAAAGVACTGGEPFRLDGAAAHCLYLSVARHTPEELARAAALLGEVAHAALPQRRMVGGA